MPRGLILKGLKLRSHSFSYVDKIKYGFLTVLAVTFLRQLVSSLAWPLGHDTSFMHYVSYLINEHGFVPYRDIFEVNMPGTYLFHIAIGKLFGYSDLAFRIVDIIWIIATLIVTWFVMKPAGQITAIASCLLFGNIYLAFGPSLSLQRDVIAILPVSIAFLISTRHYLWLSEKLVGWLLGVLFAIAALFKPHMAVGLPMVIVYHIIRNNHDLKLTKTLINRCVAISFFALLGFLPTLAAPFLWVWHIGAIQPFWEIFSTFTPLYSQLSSNVELMEVFPRIKYSVQLYLAFSGFRMLAVGSLLGVLCVWIEKSSPTARKQALALFSFSILYSIYVAIGGKFWRYHWMPYIYFSSLCTALVLLSSHSARCQRSIKSLFSLFTFALISVLAIQPSIIRYPGVYAKYPSTFIQRVDEITIYLTENIASTDTVQPLEWSGGAMYSMLRSQAVIATPYVTDFQFYHHISNPYIQQLRKDFIEKMYEKKPTIILDIQEKAKVSGVDTSYHFPELEQFIEEYYQKDYVGDGFEAFRRIDSI